MQAAAFGPGQTLLSSVHVLDLEPQGYIKPHVDSVKVGRGQWLGAPSWGWASQAKTHPPPCPLFQFCGSTIAGLSLLSPSVMRLVHTQEPGEWLELLLEPGSLYILRYWQPRSLHSTSNSQDSHSTFGTPSVIQP